MTDATARAAGKAMLDDIAPRYLARPDVDWGAMFGSVGLRVRGKVFAVATYDGDLMVKIPAERVAQRVADGSVTAVEMAGRTMREWVSMPISAGEGAWQELLDEAHAYLDEITPR
jgi:TfoX/Sxy family transcriptional regulator of competence genes